MVTHQGVGYKDHNEDRVARAYSDAGRLRLAVIDGMGGHANGEAAAEEAATTFTLDEAGSQDLPTVLQAANRRIFRRGDGSGAAAVTLEISDSGMATDMANFAWIGDCRGVIAYKDTSDGRYHRFYQTRDQGLPQALEELGTDYGAAGAGRTAMFAVDPNANTITHALGMQETCAPLTTADGEVPSKASPNGVALAGDKYKIGIRLQRGDLGLLGSDGFWENFGSTQAMLDLIKDAQTSREIAKILDHEVLHRQRLLAQAKHNPTTPLEIDLGGGRKGWLFYKYTAPDGTKMHGVVFANKSPANDERPIDHFKADNVGFAVYLHNPTG